MNYEDNRKSIKYYVKRYILNHRNELYGKTVLDLPAGNGVTSRILSEVGARPVPMDLFPEYFELKDIACHRANIKDGLTLENQSVDVVICQEGIEHFSDQLEALKEFNRVLKTHGTLLLTTPNYSNLQSKLSYLLTESEKFNSIMPPNELDSIWMLQKDISSEIYYGHIFLIGIQKLRVLAVLSGFRIKLIHFTRSKTTSLLLFPFFYPFIYFANALLYAKSLRKNNKETKKKVYKELFRLAVSPKILVGADLMIELEKIQEWKDVPNTLIAKHSYFGKT